MSKFPHVLELRIEKVTVPEKVSKGLEIKLQLGDAKKTVRKPFSEKIVLEADDVSSPLQVVYLLDGEKIGKSKVRLPKTDKSFTEPVDAKLDLDDKKITIELDFIMNLTSSDPRRSSKKNDQSDSEDYPEEKPLRSSKKRRGDKEPNGRARSSSSGEDDQATRYKNKEKRGYDDFRDSQYKPGMKDRDRDNKNPKDRKNDRDRTGKNFKDQFDNSS